MKKEKYIMMLTILILFPIFTYGNNIEHENILQIKFGGIWQVDPYLSPLQYNGMEIDICNEWWQTFHCSNDHWAHTGRLDITGMRLLSAAHTNVFYSMGVESSWGAYYHWDLCNNQLKLLLGPQLNIEYIARMHNTSYNKPYSMDLGLDCQAWIGLSYHFAAKHSSYRLRYLLYINLLGYEYMPDYWESYYEIGNGISGKHIFSGLWNRQNIRHQLTLDMQFAHSTWRIGIEHHFLHYGTPYMVNTRQQVQCIIGCIWHYRIHPSKSFTAL